MTSAIPCIVRRVGAGAFAGFTALMLLTHAEPARAAPTDQCLSSDELTQAARMASVMSVGAAIQKCGACLGQRYAQTVQHYEADDLLKDFWGAQAKIKGQSKIDFVDDLVRQAARAYSATLSNDCSACQGMADIVDGLSSAEARSNFYKAGQDKLTQLPAMKMCP